MIEATGQQVLDALEWSVHSLPGEFGGFDHVAGLTFEYDATIPTPCVGTFDTELVEEFFYAFVRNAACSLHLKKLAGKNSHHIIEGAFKSAARSLRAAVAVEEQFRDEIPSTKGVL